MSGLGPRGDCRSAEPRGVTRRRFLAAALGSTLAGACRGPGMSSPLRSRVAQIGYVAVGRPGGPNMTAFEQGLSDLGWVRDHNYVLHFRGGRGHEGEYPTLVAELLELQVDVLVATALPAVQAAMRATATVPIVMTSIGDPVRNGLIQSLSRPGGNVTGVSTIAPELSGKRLELLREVVPHSSRVAVLYNPTVADIALSWEETMQAAQILGVHLVPLPVRSATDILPAFGQAAAEQAEALLVLSDDVVFQARMHIMEQALAAGLPTMGPQAAFATAGALLSYGPDYAELFRRAAAHVDKVLKGTKPADLPVEQPMRFEFIINLQTAQALNITPSESFQRKFTRVIQ